MWAQRRRVAPAEALAKLASDRLPGGEVTAAADGLIVDL